MEVNIDKLKLSKTARKEEILAYIICGEYIFGDREVVVGDNFDESCPDIYSVDRQIGAEVVICESFKTFQKMAKKYTGLARKLRAKPESIKKLFDVNRYITKPRIERSFLQEEKFSQILKTNISNKLEKLNKHSYDSCKQKNLVILSCFRTKTFATPEKVHKCVIGIMNNYKKQYDNIYICINTNTLKIDKDKNLEILDLVKEEYVSSYSKGL